MKEIKLVAGSFVNLTSQEEVAKTKLILQNQGKDVMYIFKQAPLPTVADPAYALFNWQSVEIDNSLGDVWVASQQDGVMFVSPSSDIGHQTVEFPSDVMTSQNEGFRRLRVDQGQTSFFEGREFRTFKELNILGNATYVIKAVVPKNIILTSVAVNLDNGFMRMGTYTGGTAGVTWPETLPILARNNMSVGVDHFAPTPPTVTLTAGGTHTGGTELDVLRIKTASNNTNVNTVGTTENNVRGIAAGTYYFRIASLSSEAVAGTLHIDWEERS